MVGHWGGVDSLPRHLPGVLSNPDHDGSLRLLQFCSISSWHQEGEGGEGGGGAMVLWTLVIMYTCIKYIVDSCGLPLLDYVLGTITSITMGGPDQTLYGLLSATLEELPDRVS